MQVEEIDFEQLMGFRKKLWSGQIARPKDADRTVWWRQQVEGMKFKPMPQRGGELLPHRIGYPPQLLTIGASPVDNPDCRVTLDRKPVSGPPDTVLLWIRTETTLGFNDCFYWIAPERDYVVLRHEIHFSRDHTAWNNSTQIIDKVEQSPGGRWYAAAVRFGRIERHGEDLPAKPVAAIAKPEMGPVTTSSYRYFVEFKKDRPTHQEIGDKLGQAAPPRNSSSPALPTTGSSFSPGRRRNWTCCTKGSSGTCLPLPDRSRCCRPAARPCGAGEGAVTRSTSMWSRG
jgi:hypothetical protein